MKKNILKCIVTSILIASIILPCFSVSAAEYAKYSVNTSDPTFTVKASLQANKYHENNVYAFSMLYATIRFDPTGNGTPTYSNLDMSITVTATGATSFSPITSSGEVKIGNYISIPYTYPSKGDGITIARGDYRAYVRGSTISFNPPSIEITVFN